MRLIVIFINFIIQNALAIPLEKQVLTKLYKQQGIEIENYPEGIMVEYRDGFGIAMNYSDKVFEMKLPAGAEILIGNKSLKMADVLVWRVK